MDISLPRSGDGYLLSDAFEILFESIAHFYSEETAKNFRDWHTSESIEEKLNDPTRFFRIIYNDFGEIIAYFESRQHSTNKNTQVIQWFFVKEEYRQQGNLKELFNEFESWCKNNGYQSIWSYTALKNDVGVTVHDVLFDKTDIVNLGFGDVHWFRKELQ